MVISRYHVSSNPDVADANSEQIVLSDGPFPDHYGGELSFGPFDGYLYFGIGTGSGSSPDNLGQDLSVLRGKFLRIDVETGSPATYTIPPTNPFIGTANARPEIWDIGVRNPWRSAFDPVTGDYYIADVGQASREEVDFEPAGSSGGVNYGWNIMEGSICFGSTTCDTTGLTLPVTEYRSHSGLFNFGRRRLSWHSLSGVAGNLFLWGLVQWANPRTPTSKWHLAKLCLV